MLLTTRSPRTPLDLFMDHEYEEVRLALAMSGGVSLAVWMGGVAMEINRVIRQDPQKPKVGRSNVTGVYRDLLRLVGGEPRVDIIAGASAGGLNGALLSMSMLHDKELSELRELWLNKAGMLELLRSPTEADPPSLMKGDKYFLGKLEDAFQQLNTGRPVWDVNRMPLRLTMTTTLLRGVPSTRTDDFGLVLPDVSHQGEFLFSRGPDVPKDGFDTNDVARCLALGARSSASFPGAFEASFIPVGAETRKPPRPNMAGCVNFKTSRWAVDGGVLVNKPIRPVIREIFRQRAEVKKVRRVLAYIVPDPGTIPEDVSDEEDEAPTLGTVVLASLISLPRVESVASDLQDIADHNRRARGQRDLRERLLDPDFGCDVSPMAGGLFDLYRRFLARATVERIQASMDPHEARAVGMTDGAWQSLRELVERHDSPWVPSSLDTSDDRWNVGTAEAAAAMVLDLIRRGLDLARLDGERREAEDNELVRTRVAVHNQLAWLHHLAEFERRRWGEEANVLLKALKDRTVTEPADAAPETGTESMPGVAGFLEGWIRERRRIWADPERPPGPIPAEIVRELAEVAGRVKYILEQTAESALGSEQARPARMTQAERRDADFIRALMKHLFAPSEEIMLRAAARLLELTVIQYTFLAGMPTIDQPVEFMQISANTANGLDKRDTVDEKLAGVQVGHFGAFYKRSWRANDWMWGRLDGAQRLVQMLLNPARLRDRGFRSNLVGSDLVDEVLAHIHALAVPRKTPESPPHEAALAEELERRWREDRRAIREELSFLENPTVPPPPMVPVAAGAIARRIQVGVLQEELLQVAQAVDFDQQLGSALSPEARDFLNRVEDTVAPGVRWWSMPDLRPGGWILGSPGEKLDPKAAIDLFSRCTVGEERITGEVGSDLFTSTTATAAAVGISALSGKRSGLGVLRVIVGAARSASLALYLLAKNAVRRSRTGFAIMSMLLAIGGALLAISLPGRPEFLEDPRTWIGAVLVAAGTFMLSVRAGAPSAVFFLLISIAAAVGPYVWIKHHFLPDQPEDSWKMLRRATWAIPALSLIVVSPLLGWLHESRLLRFLAKVLTLAALVAVVVLGWSHYQEPSPVLALTVPLATLVLGFVGAWVIGIRRARKRQLEQRRRLIELRSQ